LEFFFGLLRSSSLLRVLRVPGFAPDLIRRATRSLYRRQKAKDRTTKNTKDTKKEKPFWSFSSAFFVHLPFFVFFVSQASASAHHPAGKSPRTAGS
jgi:hypothetical protein